VFPIADQPFEINKAPFLDYSVYLHKAGEVDLEATFAPSWPFAPGRGLRYAVAIDDEAPQIIDLVKDMSDGGWEESVRSDMRKGVSKHSLTTAGVHRVRIYAVDPGVTFERLVVNAGGLQPSYLGPLESPQAGH